MSNRLTAAQKQLFSSDHIASQYIQFVCEITDGTNSTDIADYVESYGSTEDRLYGFNEQAGTSIEYPSLTLQVINTNGEFSIGTASSFLPSGLTAYSIKFGVYETYTSSTPQVLVKEVTWPIAELELSPGQATITAVHPLYAAYGREWTDDDRHTAVWVGDHYGADWDNTA